MGTVPFTDSYNVAIFSDKDPGSPVWDEHVPEEKTTFTMATLLSSLSSALDLTEGQPMGHAIRTCLIALRISDAMGLPAEVQADLHLAALLKDSGCSSNAARMFAIFGCDDIAAKGDSKVRDWRRVTEAMRFALTHTMPDARPVERLNKLRELMGVPGRVMDVLTEARCTRGANIARSLRLNESVAEAIYHLDEHWDGKGAPHNIAGEEIPIVSRILCVAQSLDVFAFTFGARRAYAVIRERCGRWFDPACVRAAESFRKDIAFWDNLHDDPQTRLTDVTSDLLQNRTSEADVDAICNTFAEIVDAKSTFTAQHSSRVADVAVTIGSRLGLDPAGCRLLYRAGLLHDLGKLGVPNAILDKPGSLTTSERLIVQRHPSYTEAILKPIPGFGRLAKIAAAHHEKLDGSGYHRGVTSEHLDLEMRILAVADTYDALAADRPYRTALMREEVQHILRRDAGIRLDADCVEALLA